MKIRFQEIYLNNRPENFIAGMRKWLSWVMRSRLVAMKEIAKTIKRHWDGVINWIDFKVSNGILEGFNSKFQTAKAKARCYRKMETVKTVIYLLSGKLDFSIVNLSVST